MRTAVYRVVVGIKLPSRCCKISRIGNRVAQEMQGRPDGRCVRRRDLTQGPGIYDDRSRDAISCVSQSGRKDLACKILIWWLVCVSVFCKAGRSDGLARPSCKFLKCLEINTGSYTSVFKVVLIYTPVFKVVLIYMPVHIFKALPDMIHG